MTRFNKLLIASLKEFSRDRTTLSFTVVVPILLVVFFGFAFSGSSSRLTVGVVDPSSATSSGFGKVYAVLRRDHSVSVQRGSLSAEMGKLRDGSIDAVLSPSAKESHIYFDRGNGQVALAVQSLASQIGQGSRADADVARGSSPTAHPPTDSTRGLSPATDVARGLSPTADPPRHHTATSGSRLGGVKVAVGGTFPNSRLDFVIPGILATAIMWLGIFSAIPLVQQREQQVLRRFAVTPVSRSRLVLAQIAGRLFVSLCQALFVLLAARFIFGVPIGSQFRSPIEAFLGIAGLVLIGALGFVAIGYAVAALSATQSSAHAWAQLITMPMLLLAGVFFPISVFPGFLKPIAAVLPLTYLADALRQTAMSGEHFASIGVDLVMLALWVVVPLAVAIRYFRWT